MWHPHGRNTTASTHIPSSGPGRIKKCDDGSRSTHAEFRVLLAARDTSPGHPPKLGPDQLRLVPDFLSHGEEADGFRGEVWTCARVAKVIEEEFGVSYHQGHVSRLLKQLHWTPQMPIARAIQRDEQEIEQW